MSSSLFLPGDKALFCRVQENKGTLVWLTLSFKPYLMVLKNCCSLSLNHVFLFHLTRSKAMHIWQFYSEGGICVLRLVLIAYAKSSRQEPCFKNHKIYIRWNFKNV